MRFEPQTTNLILAASRCAAEMGHSCVDSVHLLLALSQEPGRLGLQLRNCGMEPEKLGQLVAVLYGKGTPDLPLPQGLSPDAKRILQTAAREARTLNARSVEVGHVLIALLRQGGQVRELLRLFGSFIGTYRGNDETEKGGDSNEITGSIQRGPHHQGPVHGAGDWSGTGDRYGYRHSVPEE